MFRLFPCIPIFKGFFLLKVQKECVYVIMLKIALLLFKICFGGKKGYMQIIVLGSPKTYCLPLFSEASLVDVNFFPRHVIHH